jgi:hypothetical protein
VPQQYSETLLQNYEKSFFIPFMMFLTIPKIAPLRYTEFGQCKKLVSEGALEKWNDGILE